MIDFLKVLALFVLAALGWWLGTALPRLAFRINAWAAKTVVAVCLLDAVAGLFPFSIPFHRTLGYGATIVACLLASWAAGLLLQRALAGGDQEAGLGALVTFLIVPVSLLTVVSGSIGPTHALTPHPVLFPLLHIIAAPLALAALLAGWLIIARRTSLDG